MDLVNKQAIYDKIAKRYPDRDTDQYAVGYADAINDVLKDIRYEPSAEPEIIRCCKCVYWQQDTVRQNSNDAGWWNEALCKKHTIYGNEPHEAWVDADWYCADAERRTDE